MNHSKMTFVQSGCYVQQFGFVVFIFRSSHLIQNLAKLTENICSLIFFLALILSPVCYGEIWLGWIHQLTSLAVCCKIRFPTVFFTQGKSQANLCDLFYFFKLSFLFFVLQHLQATTPRNHNALEQSLTDVVQNTCS